MWRMSSQEQSRPNILFLLSDEHSFRFFSCLSKEEGGEPVRTPTLDRLATGGAWFRQAYCTTPLCTPSRIAMLTGRHQERCGAWGNKSIVPPDLPTIPGYLAQAGYETCAVGKMHFGGSRQFAGFRHRPYGDTGGVGAGHQWDPINRGPREAAPASSGPRQAGLEREGGLPRIKLAGVTEIPEAYLQEHIVVQESIAFLREHRHRAQRGEGVGESSKPWMLCASFSRPHFPWTAPRRYFERYWPDGATPPRVGRDGDLANHPFAVKHRKNFRVDDLSEEDTMRGRAAYFACVDFLDEIVGDFLAILERDGFLENTIVVYTTDHGESCGEHGLWFKTMWNEAAARVPFIIQTPEHRSGTLAPTKVEMPVSLCDLFPTLCGLTGVEPPNTLDGVDLSGAIRDSASQVEHGPVFCQHLPNWRMIRRGAYKYVAVRDFPEMLLNVEEDPDEQHNLAGDPAHSELLKELREIALDGFSFEEVQRQAREEHAALEGRFPRRVEGQTPNQMILPDGRLVEGDAVLYLPHVLAEDAKEAFADYPV